MDSSDKAGVVDNSFGQVMNWLGTNTPSHPQLVAIRSLVDSLLDRGSGMPRRIRTVPVAKAKKVGLPPKKVKPRPKGPTAPTSPYLSEPLFQKRKEAADLLTALCTWKGCGSRELRDKKDELQADEAKTLKAYDDANEAWEARRKEIIIANLAKAGKAKAKAKAPPPKKAGITPPAVTPDVMDIDKSPPQEEQISDTGRKDQELASAAQPDTPPVIEEKDFHKKRKAEPKTSKAPK